LAAKVDESYPPHELAGKVAAQPPLSVAMTKLTVNRLAHALDDLASHMDVDQFAPSEPDGRSQGGCGGVPGSAQAEVSRTLRCERERPTGDVLERLELLQELYPYAS
jgi:hypothetical protein